MARWGNRYARNRARQAYNNWWRSTGKKMQSPGSPEDNSGCGTAIILFVLAIFLLANLLR